VNGDVIKVGPDGNGSYRFSINGKVGAVPYYNAASARAGARRLIQTCEHKRGYLDWDTGDWNCDACGAHMGDGI